MSLQTRIGLSIGALILCTILSLVNMLVGTDDPTEYPQRIPPVPAIWPT